MLRPTLKPGAYVDIASFTHKARLSGGSTRVGGAERLTSPMGCGHISAGTTCHATWQAELDPSSTGGGAAPSLPRRF
jgi:hypothetical protein